MPRLALTLDERAIFGGSGVVMGALLSVRMDEKPEEEENEGEDGGATAGATAGEKEEEEEEEEVAFAERIFAAGTSDADTEEDRRG